VLKKQAGTTISCKIKGLTRCSIHCSHPFPQFVCKAGKLSQAGAARTEKSGKRWLAARKAVEKALLLVFSAKRFFP
jgi:hypothetical protein